MPRDLRYSRAGRASGAFEQSFVIPLDGLLHRRHGLLAFLAGRSGVGVVVQFDAGAVGQQSQRVHEVQVLDLAHERDLVTRGATAEAVVAALFGVHRERRASSPRETGHSPVQRRPDFLSATVSLMRATMSVAERTCAISLSDMAIARRYRFSLTRYIGRVTVSA